MTTRVFLATVALLAALIVPLGAQASTIRVTSAAQPMLGNLEWASGSAPAYVNDANAAVVLPARSALGQLVAATSFTSTPLVVKEFAGLGPYVASIGTVKVGAKGAWMLFVNGTAAQVGAGSLQLAKKDRVLWVLDTDYAKKGPFVLDARVTKQADGDVLVRVTKIGGTKAVAAKGATIVVDGKAVGTTDAAGHLTYTPRADWDVLQARQAGSIASQLVLE